MSDDADFDVVEAINELQREQVLAWVQERLDENAPPHDVAQSLTAGLERLGDRFAAGECFIPELVMGAEIFSDAMDKLGPAIEATGIELEKVGTVVIGTVQGDLHDLGKNLVSITLVADGFEVINLGVDVPTEKFVEEVRRRQPDFLGMSALLTTTMERQRDVIDALKAANLRDTVKVMVGGAPVNQRWVDEIGADAHGSDAVDALRKAKAMLGIA